MTKDGISACGKPQEPRHAAEIRLRAERHNAVGEAFFLATPCPPLTPPPPALHPCDSGNFSLKKASVRMQDTLSLSSIGCAKAELQVSKVKMRLSTAWRRRWGLASRCLNLIDCCAYANRRRKLVITPDYNTYANSTCFEELAGLTNSHRANPIVQRLGALYRTILQTRIRRWKPTAHHFLS